MVSSIQQLKEVLKNPVLLSKYRVVISGDADGSLSALVSQIDIPLNIFSYRGVKAGGVMSPYFDGINDESILSFKISFRETADQKVSKFFDNLKSKKYVKGGLIDVNGEMESRLSVKVYLLNSSFYRETSSLESLAERSRELSRMESSWEVGYSFNDCSWEEETDIELSESSNSSLFRMYKFYFRSFERLSSSYR